MKAIPNFIHLSCNDSSWSHTQHNIYGTVQFNWKILGNLWAAQAEETDALSVTSGDEDSDF
jgi:hypothetical protein